MYGVTVLARSGSSRFFMPISDVLTRLCKHTIFSSPLHDFLFATPRPFLSYSKPVSPLFVQNVREK